MRDARAGRVITDDLRAGWRDGRMDEGRREGRQQEEQARPMRVLFGRHAILIGRCVAWGSIGRATRCRWREWRVTIRIITMPIIISPLGLYGYLGGYGY